MVVLNRDEALAAISHTDIVVLDVETHKVPTFTGKTLMGVALGFPKGLGVDTYYVLPDELPAFGPRLVGLDIVAHNVIFDSEIMLQNGVDITKGTLWDTMVMSHIVNENEYSFSLDFLAKKYCNEGKSPISLFEKAFGSWNRIPEAIMGPYAMQDVTITWKLFMHMRAKLTELQLDTLYSHYSEYLKALRYIQSQGIVVDWGMVEQKHEETQETLADIRFQLRYDPAKSTALNRRLYDILKLKPVAMTATGKPKTDVAALNRLRARHSEHAAEITQILRYRNLLKADGNWYGGYLRYRDGEETLSCIHPNFKPHGTKTGRLSCEAPNLQQIPREYKRVKCFFRDDPASGEVLVELDYSQIELRVAAYYANKAGDPTMYEIYERGEDVHSRSTELIGAFDQIDNRSEARQVGKTGNFLWIYGGGAATMSDQLFRQFGFRSTVEQCQGWTDRFHEAYPGFQACIANCERLHKRDGYISMFNGRRRHIRERDKFNRTAHRKAFNARVQGGCGQLLMYALIRIHKAVERDELKVRVCNTVHDSIWVYIPEALLEEQTAELKRLMRITPENIFKLPFEVDAKELVQA